MTNKKEWVLDELSKRMIYTELAINITTSVLRPMFDGFTTILNKNTGFTPLPEKFVKIPDVIPVEYGIHDLEILLDFYDEICKKGKDTAESINDPEKEAALNDVIEASRTAMDTIKSGEEFKEFLEICRKGKDTAESINDPEKEAALNDVIEAFKTAMDTFESGGKSSRKSVNSNSRRYLRVHKPS